MPDEYDDDDDVQDESSVIKELRKQLKAAEKDAAEAPALRKQVALNDAGLGALSEIQRKALLASHDGELTSEGLKATASALGFTAEAAKTETNPVTAEEQAAHERQADVTSAAQASEAQVTTLDDRLAAAKSSEELMEILAKENMLLSE